MAHWKRPISPLGALFVGYLHQDWRDEYADVWSAVDAYVGETPSDKRVAARLELLQILDECDSEDALSRAADAQLLAYHPPGAGLTYREWLEQLERYLRRHED